jgi:SH3 domain protein
MTKFNPSKLPANLQKAVLNGALAGVLSLTTTAVLVPSTAHAVENATTAQSGGSIRYVTDSLEVPLRRGPGYKYKISRMLKSGEPVKVLEVSDSGWVRVQYKTKNKTYEGWMPTILLQNQPISKVRLAEQIEKNNRLESENNQLKRELQALRARFDETESTLKQVQQEKFKLDKAYQELKEKSANAMALDEENKSLKERLKQAESQLVIYKQQLDEAEDTVKRQWFLTGAGVLLLGLLLGRFFRPPQRRQKWNSL